MANEFTCANCRRVFEKAVSDEVALAEAQGLFSPAELATGLAIVCDDCFQAVLLWQAMNSNAPDN